MNAAQTLAVYFRKITRPKGEGDGAAFVGLKREPLKAGELDVRGEPLVAVAGWSEIELNDLIAFYAAAVAYVDSGGEGLAGFEAGGGKGEAGVSE